jgi:hypothetical protein
MASLYIVWNIGDRNLESVHETQAAAAAALNDILAKRGDVPADKVRLEIVTVPR